MSKQVDERVVSMKFDNAQFENGVKTSLSTLDKLKNSLNFKSASTELNNINTAANKVNMSGISKGIESIQAKFSALDVMAVTALANITNSAVNAGRRITRALTIEPIFTGFQEYETQINAVQTILANTRSEGTTIKDVNSALDELNKYADLTIYNFTEMTRNIGTFTAAGVKLDTSVSAIQGIANLAAVSGSSSQQASVAMYQLSQALAAGTVKLQDWNSVVNAGMGGQVFQNALKETSKELNTGAEAAIKAKGSFRESLQTGWLTSKVLTETLKKFTTSGANEYVAKYTGLSKEAVEETLKSAKAKYGEADAIEHASKALAEKSGKNAKEIQDALEFAKTAEDAATKVKTFTQLWDVLKEAVQSGWSQTWRLIFGDFEEAKALFTPLANFLTGIISKISDTRNAIIKGALESPFGKMAKNISKVQKSFKGATETVKNYGKVVDRIINGDFGNGKTRIDKLTKAGYDWAHAQNLVNEKLKDGTRHTTNYKEAQKEVSKTQEKTIDQLAKMSDAQLKSLGYNEKYIKDLRALQEQAKKTGIPLNEFIKNIDQLDGRTLIINSFKNAGSGLVKVITSIRDAWREAFYGKASEEDIIKQKTEHLYNMIAAIHKFSLKLKMSNDTADKLKRTFRGVFALFDLLTSVIGGPFKIAFKMVLKLLGKMDIDILSATASMGDAIVKFRDWIFNNNLISKSLDKVIFSIKKAIKYIKDLFNSFVKLPEVQKSIKKFKKTFTDIPEIGKNLMAGLKKGLEDGKSTIIDVLINFGKQMLEAIKKVLGIHSPSTETEEIGNNFILGFVNAINSGIEVVITALKKLGSKALDTLRSFDFGAVLAAAFGVGIFVLLKKISDAFDVLTGPIKGISSVLEGAGNALTGFGNVLNGFAMKTKAKALKDLAISIAILVGALVLLAYVAKKDGASLGWAILVITTITALIGGLAIAVSKAVSKIDVKNALKIVGLAGALVLMANAVLTLSSAMLILSTIDWKQGLVALGGLTAIIGSFIALLWACEKFDKGSENISKIGWTFITLSVSMLILAKVLKIVSKLDPKALDKGIDCIGSLTLFIAGLMAATLLIGKRANMIGGTLLKISFAILLLTFVIKSVSKLDPNALEVGKQCIEDFALLIIGLIATTNLAGDKIDEVGKTILAISASILLLIVAIKLVSKLKPTEIAKGIVAIGFFELLILGLVKITQVAEKDSSKIAGTLLAMVAAIAILSAVAVALSFVDVTNLAKGIIAVGLLSVMLSRMMIASQYAKGSKGAIMAMGVAIGIMAASMIALSFIDFTKALKALSVLSVAMLVFAGMLNIANGFTAGLASLIVMTVAVGLIGGIIFLLGQLPIESAIASASALSIVLLSMSVSLAIVGAIGPMAISGLVAVGVMTLVVGGLALVIKYLSDLQVESVLGIAKSLSVLILSLSGACVLLGIAGAFGIAALAGIGVLMLLISSLGLLFSYIGKLVTKNPELETFVTKSIPILQKIGTGLGSFIGGIIGGIGLGIAATLPAIASNIQTFINTLGSVDPSATDGIKNIADAMMTLSKANMMNALSSLLGGESSVSKYVSELPLLGKGLKGFSDAVEGINAENVIVASKAAKALAQMTAVIPNEGGVVGWFAGENSIAKFGKELPALGKGLKGFSDSVAGINTENVTAASKAAKSLTEMTKNIPNEGGVVGWFAGENSIAKFGKDLPALGKGLKGFSDSVAGINSENITSASKAAKSLTEMTKTIPNEGGMVAWFTGDNSLAKFANKLPTLGKGLKGFSDAVTDINSENITAAAKAAKSLAEMSKTIPNEGGMAAWFTGDNSVAKFAKKLPALGKGLKGFSDSVEGIDPTNITAASKAAKNLAQMAKTAPDNTDKLKSFGENLVKFGSKLKKFFSNSSGISNDTISTVTNGIKDINKTISGLNTKGIYSASKSINSLIKTIKNMSNITGDSTAGFVKSLNGLGKASIAALTKNFKDAGPKMKKMGSEMINKFIAGINSQESKAKKGATKIASSCATAIKSKRKSFSSAGKDLGDGLVAGINSKQNAAYNAGYKLGQKAVQGEKDGQKSHSPSKLTIQAGKWLGEGLVIGIGKMTKSVYNAGHNMGKVATDTISNAISKVSSFVNSDIDAQPTIRPVLDLSDVSAGANAINSMLGLSPSVGVLSNVRSINSMMNRNQNGANDDVVSAINDLGKAISNMSGDTYSINGITYDDGSNITNAVQSIVRAARQERRI